MKLLIINPGSTSTKLSLYEDDKELFTESEFHDAPVLLTYPNVNDQVPFRKEVILSMLSKHGYSIEDVDVFVGRGGSAYPQKSGVLKVDERLYQDTLNAVGGSEHSAKLGVLLAYPLAVQFGKPVYTMDATNVDEFNDLARVTGIKGIYRNAQSHTLNQKAVAKKHAQVLGKKYEECNFIVCHIDGGVTVGAHMKGKMTDGSVGAGGDGPFAPTRTGAVPVLPLIDYLETHSLDEVRLTCSRAGGFVSWFGTSNADKVFALVQEKDQKAVLIWEAMKYNICKYIGEMSTVLSGKIDSIILTGGLMRFPDIEETIRERCGWIAPIAVYPGEMEQEAMCYAVLKVLNGEEEAMTYTGKPVWGGFGFDI